MTLTNEHPTPAVIAGDSRAIDRATVLPDGVHERRPSWLDGFRRITTTGEFIPEIDGLRFIAIAAVVLRHVAVMVAFWLNDGTTGTMYGKENLLLFGRHGVELFFAISGFILATPFAMHALQGAKPVKLKRYFLRRLTRLEPPYLLSLCIMMAFKMHFDAGRAEWKNFFLSAFYVHGITIGQESHISFVTWSLEVEIQFYILMPLLALLYLIRSRFVRRSMIVLAALLAMAFQPVPIYGLLTGIQYMGTLPNYIQYFLVGLLLADVYATEWGGAPPAVKKTGIKWGDFVWLIGWPLLLIAFVQLAPGDSSPGRFIDVITECVRNFRTHLTAWPGRIFDITLMAIPPALIFCLYISLFHSVWARKLMRLPVVATIGGMCYSIYLLHNFIVKGGVGLITHHMARHFYPAFFVSCLVTIPIVLIFCGAFFRLVERPCMRPDWPKRLRNWLAGSSKSIQPSTGA